ncbi:LuxR family transcriptional regulator [Methyloraptor flagellatus]|uniref:LuxR family transcriptional regulator n=1 Tax=Methyloraptor flagellatus TaxID=3162530 RepID=A0AAU7X7J5_9HYPH
MSRIPLERTFAFVQGIQAANTAAEVTDRVRRETSALGVQYVVAGVIPSPTLSVAAQARHILLGEWPREWGDAYFRRGLLRRDPTIRRVLRQVPAFSWRTIGVEDTSDDLALMDEAREHGLAEGVTVPMMSLDGRPVGFSFAGRHVDDSPEASGVFTLIANFAAGRVLEIRRNQALASTRLTRREAEVLSWASVGKTDWEISVILSVSEAAVRKHFHNARSKLGAMNRTHAVALALRQAIIR